MQNTRSANGCKVKKRDKERVKGRKNIGDSHDS